jgi:hypothetical protein
MSLDTFFEEVQFVEQSIVKVRQATAAIGKLQDMYSRAYNPQEEASTYIS